jgi:hypothetical protein
VSDALDTILDAVAAMHPITKSWLIHGAIVTEALTRIDADDLSDEQCERLADGCREWGKLLADAGLLWFDAEEHWRRRAEAA